MEYYQLNKQQTIALIHDERASIDYFKLSRLWQNDKDVALEVIKKDGFFLSLFSSDIKNDREIALAAINSSADGFSYVSQDLKDDRELVLFALSKNLSSFDLISQRLKNDKDIVLYVVKSNGMKLSFLENLPLHHDREIILTAINQDGRALKYAPPVFQDDKEIVLSAINNKIFSLKYASDRLQNDKELLRILKDKVKNASNHSIHQKWYEARMVVLQIYEEEEWMMEHGSKHLSHHKTRKF